jgi:DNA-binding response OmpR family regulator
VKILIIDDDRDLLASLRRVLVGNEFEVDTCDNAADAVPLADNGNYDLLLVDYKMPDKDGIWFMTNVRPPRKTKAVLITAYVNREIIGRMFELGAVGYLIKPFDDEELLRHIRFYSGQDALPRRHASP